MLTKPTMSILLVVKGSTIEVLGNTFPHKEYLKNLGARWESSAKVWRLTNTKHALSILSEYVKKTAMVKRRVRRCGHCGEAGHNRTKCEKYANHLKNEKIAKAKESRANPPRKFRMLENSAHCACKFVDVEGCPEAGQVPEVCKHCLLWCCSKAQPHPKSPKNPFDCWCPIHGCSIERFLNDTRGT